VVLGPGIERLDQEPLVRVGDSGVMPAHHRHASSRSDEQQGSPPQVPAPGGARRGRRNP
jgi:hypothetical protein